MDEVVQGIPRGERMMIGDGEEVMGAFGVQIR